MTERTPPRRYWFPAVVLALLVGLGLIAASVYWRSFGYNFTFGIPVAVGILVGYGARVRVAFLIALAISALIGLLGAAVMMELSGLLCGVVFFLIAVVPMLAGTAMGWLLRRRIEAKQAHRKNFPTVLMIAVLPLPMLHLEGRQSPDFPFETVETHRHLAMTPEAAWESLIFYEDVRHEPSGPGPNRPSDPPLHPRRHRRCRDLKRCVYDGGFLIKRITAHEPGRILAFDVVQQQGIEDRSIRLIDGSFSFEPVADGGTRVTLVTRYEPYSRPASSGARSSGDWLRYFTSTLSKASRLRAPSH